VESVHLRSFRVMVPLLTQMKPVHIIVPYILNFILMLSSHLSMVLLSDLFPEGFPTKIRHSSLSPAMRITCHAQPIMFYLITNTFIVCHLLIYLFIHSLSLLFLFKDYFFLLYLFLSSSFQSLYNISFSFFFSPFVKVASLFLLWCENDSTKIYSITETLHFSHSTGYVWKPNSSSVNVTLIGLKCCPRI
jgi:hypothetical protein